MDLKWGPRNGFFCSIESPFIIDRNFIELSSWALDMIPMTITSTRTASDGRSTGRAQSEPRQRLASEEWTNCWHKWSGDLLESTTRNRFYVLTVIFVAKTTKKRSCIRRYSSIGMTDQLFASEEVCLSDNCYELMTFGRKSDNGLLAPNESWRQSMIIKGTGFVTIGRTL